MKAISLEGMAARVAPAEAQESSVWLDDHREDGLPEPMGWVVIGVSADRPGMILVVG